MKKIKENKKTTFLFLGIALSALVLVGTSYAWWTTTATQTEVNVVQSSCLKLTITNEEHDISLPEAYPIPDQEGKKLEPYTFTIENNCDTPVDYTIALETLPETTLNSEYVKYELVEMGVVYILELDFDGQKDSMSFQTREDCQQMLEIEKEGIESMGGKITIECEVGPKEETVRYLSKLSEEPNEEKYVLEDAKEGKVLLQYTLNGNESIDYELRLWMDNDTPAIDDTMNQKFQSKIVLKGEVAAPGILVTTNSSSMWQYKEQITQIVIEDKIQKPEETEVLGPFDESRYQDKSVISYLVPNEDGEGTYTAHLQGNGGITLNYNSSNLFYNFNKVTSIEGIENLNTSKVRNMSSLFYGMKQLNELDLGDNFDTSQVTNMSAMFYNMSSLTALNLKDNFDTSQVTDMSFMFAYMGSLAELNLGDKFDTGQVTDMSFMFISMRQLKQLNLENKFDTSQVTDMSSMFENMGSLAELNLGDKFDTSQVTNMQSMFDEMSSLTELNLGDKFDTSNVTNMASMFSNVGNLETLELGDKFDTSQVTNMSFMFSRNLQLRTIEYGNRFVHKQGADITHMFYNCPANKPTKATHPSWDGVVFN